MKINKKISAIAERLEADIEKGRYGQSGERFLTTRTLAAECRISLEYANEVLHILASKNRIMLLGKHYYLTYKKAGLNSPFYLKYQPKQTFGMIISDLNNAFISGLAQETANAVAQTPYSLRIVIENHSRPVLEELLQERISGIFVDPYIAGNHAEEIIKCPIPVVSIGNDLSGQGIDSITVDNFRAGKMIADHFCEIGCKKFAYIGFEGSPKTDQRLNGYRINIEKNGFFLQPDKTVRIRIDESGKYDRLQLFSETKNLIWKISSFEKTGIFCYHDLLAYEVITMLGKMDLESRDLKIPQNIAIAGFDDLSIASAIKPNLTTISYPTKEMAQKAVTSMIDAVTDVNHKEGKKEVDFSLIQRRTTAE